MGTSTLPQINSTWTVNMRAQGHPGATAVHILGYDCRFETGLLLSGGELLVNVASRLVLQVDMPVTGGITPVQFQIPNEPTLVGEVAYLQGVISGNGTEFCNAMRVVIGL